MPPIDTMIALRSTMLTLAIDHGSSARSRGRPPRNRTRSRWRSPAAPTARRGSPRRGIVRGGGLGRGRRTARATSSSPSAATAASTSTRRCASMRSQARRASAARSRRASRLHRASSAHQPEIAVTWNAKDDATAIKTARSRDGGRTFVDAQNLAGGGRARRSRLAGDRRSMRSGALHAIWLDHRGMAAQGGGRSFGAQRRARRRGDGAEVRALLRDADRRAASASCSRASATAARPRWRSGRTARSTRPGVTCSPATCATWASPCRATAARPSRR